MFHNYLVSAFNKFALVTCLTTCFKDLHCLLVGCFQVVDDTSYEGEGEGEGEEEDEEDDEEGGGDELSEGNEGDTEVRHLNDITILNAMACYKLTLSQVLGDLWQCFSI